jgi:hypothetical protein
MKNYSTKKIGEIANGSTINFKGNEIEIGGIWNNTKVLIADPDGVLYASEDEPICFLKGDVMNGTMYDATLYVHKVSDYNKQSTKNF